MIYFLGGNEPYMVDCRRIELVGELKLPELNLMEASAFTDDVAIFLTCCPIEDDRKVAYVTVDNLAECNTPAFERFEMCCPIYATLIVRFRACDKKTSFYKRLVKDNLLTMYDKDGVVSSLPSFVQKRATKLGGTFLPGALEEFLRRENYSDSEYTTIYSLLSDLKNLISYDAQISVDTVKAVVSEKEKENRWALARMIASGNIQALRAQAQLLQGQEIEVLSALLREYRLAYKASFYPLKEIGANNIVFLNTDRGVLCEAINFITEMIDSIKIGSVPSAVVLENVFLKLCMKKGA